MSKETKQVNMRYPIRLLDELREEAESLHFITTTAYIMNIILSRKKLAKNKVKL